MAHWCESCGQQMLDGETTNDATWLGAPTGHQHSFAKPGGEDSSGREKKLVLAVLAAFAVWGAFVGLGSIVSPADTIDEQAASDIEQARVEREEAAAQQAVADKAQAQQEAAEQAAAGAEDTDEVAAERPEIAEVAGDYGAADAAPGFPVVTNDGQGAASVQVQRLQRQLTRRDSSAFVAYRSSEGIVIIDLVGGRASVAELAPGIGSIGADAELLRSGSSTFAIDPATLQASRVALDSGVAVSDTLDGNTYLVEIGTSSGQGALVEVIADGEYGFYRAPETDLQMRAVDGVGLLAASQSRTGATLIAGGEEFSTLSEHHVLAGTSGTLLEQLCETETQCSLAVTDIASGERSPVPPRFVRDTDQYSLSPNAEMLLRYSPEGFAEIHVAETDTILWVTGLGMRSPAWSPNSDFVAWIDRIGDPTLKVMFPDERDWLTLELNDFDAPAPLSPELIVFTSERSIPGDPRDES